MQAGRPRADRVAGGQAAQHAAAGDGRAAADGAGERFVGRAEAVGVLDGDDAATGERAGEDDHTGAGGDDRIARGAAEVDAAVPGPVRRRRWVERPHHRGPSHQRPPPPTPGHPARTRDRARPRDAAHARRHSGAGKTGRAQRHGGDRSTVQAPGVGAGGTARAGRNGPGGRLRTGRAVRGRGRGQRRCGARR